MTIDDRFDDLAASLVGFYRTWVIHLGMELGLFERIRSAGPDGIEPYALAAAAACDPGPTGAWLLAAHGAELVEFDGERARIDPAVAAVLLDADRPEYLGGQFQYTVTASLDHDKLAEFVRTGRTVGERPPRYYRAIERLTAQDIAVFFEEALAAIPDIVTELASGGDVLDLHCGGGRWLIAVARRFAAARLVGVEIEPDSFARATRNVDAAGLADRIRIESREVERIGYEAAFDLAYFQYALHQVVDPPAALAAARRALRPGGRLLVLAWCLPSAPDAYRTAHGELMAGTQLDELFQGTGLHTREAVVGIFEVAGLPAPDVVELPSGATLFHHRVEG
jgi:SAM-dependent methyltransferase